MTAEDAGRVTALRFTLDTDATEFGRWLRRELGDSVQVHRSMCFLLVIGAEGAPVPPSAADARAEFVLWRMAGAKTYVRLSIPPATSRQPNGPRDAERMGSLYFACNDAPALDAALRPILERVAALHPEADGAIRAWLLDWGAGDADAEDAPPTSIERSDLAHGQPLPRRVTEGPTHVPRRPYLRAKWRMALPIIQALRRNGLSNRQISDRLGRDHPDCAMSDKTIRAVLRAAELGQLAS